MLHRNTMTEVVSVTVVGSQSLLGPLPSELGGCRQD
jgi:hypothetical protein